MLLKTPSKARELLKYCSSIPSASKQNPTGWVIYDTLFRQRLFQYSSVMKWSLVTSSYGFLPWQTITRHLFMKNIVLILITKVIVRGTDARMGLSAKSVEVRILFSFAENCIPENNLKGLMAHGSLDQCNDLRLWDL